MFIYLLGSSRTARPVFTRKSWTLLWIVFFTCLHSSIGDDVREECGNWEPIENIDNGVLLSPNFPAPYPSNLTCDWLVWINGSRSFEFYLQFFDSGSADTLSIFEENPTRGTLPRWSFSGHVEGQSFLAERSVWFRLISSGGPGTSSRRFKIEFQAIFNETNTCQDLLSPDNGHISHSNFSVGSVAQFTCDPGFKLQGQWSLQCLSDTSGTPFWSGVPPSCEAPCVWNKDHLGQNGSFYLVPADTGVLLSPNYPQDMIGPISCAWEINAPDGLNITTQIFTAPEALLSLEMWANPMTDFLQPGLRKNLIMNITSFEQPFTLTIHLSTVSMILRVQRIASIGRFVLKIDRFAITVCGLPPLSDYLTYYPAQDQYNFGEAVTYSCEGSYALTTNRDVTNVCSENGQWEKDKPQSLPVCSADCLTWSPSQQSYIPIVFTSSSGVLYSKAYPNNIPLGICNYTFLAEPGEVHILELISAHLVSTELFIVEPFGFTVDWDTSVYASKSNIVYLLVNQSLASSSDIFTINFQTYTADVECSPPTLPNFMTYLAQNFTIGSIVTFNCEISFEVIGGNESTCILQNTTAQWWPDVPMCMGRCGGTYVSDNITIVSPMFPNSYDSEHNPVCIWDITNIADQPFEVSLSAMDMLYSDNLTITDTDEITYLNYICSQNCSWFRTVTSSSRVIVEFSPTAMRPPVHRPLVFSILFLSTSLLMCDSPGALANGQVLGNDFLEGSSVHYICHRPYDLEGARESTCVRNDEYVLAWDSSPPHCIIRDCTPPSRPQSRNAGRGAIASPGYPGNILKGQQECLWVITAVEETYRISLHFRYLDLPEAQAGTSSSVLIFDVGDSKNDLLANFTAGTPLENVTSNTNAIRVEYFGPDHNVRGYRGIYLDYDVIEPLLTTTSQPPLTSTKSTQFLTSTIPTKISTSPELTTSVTSSVRADDTTPTSVSAKSTGTPTTSTTLTPDKSTRTLDQRGSGAQGTDSGRIVAGVIVPILGLIVVSVLGYFWYRHKYPVRMVLGKDFGKFANPIYVKGASTLTLVREDAPKREG